MAQSFWASPAQRLWQVPKEGGLALRSEGAVGSTIGGGNQLDSKNRQVSRRFMNAAYNRSRGIRTRLVSELESPNAVKKSAGDQPCGRIQVEVSVEQWRKGAGRSTDVFQQATIIDGGD